MSLLLLFNQFETVYTDTTYALLREYTPSNKNKVLGLITSTGSIYCRVDMQRYHVNYDATTKYITYQNTLRDAYNCIKCGYRITITDTRIRYEKRHKIGKRRFN